MIVTTTNTVEGHPITAYKGIVVGEAIMGANIVRDFFASVTDVIGGRSGALTKLVKTCAAYPVYFGIKDKQTEPSNTLMKPLVLLSACRHQPNSLWRIQCVPS